MILHHFLTEMEEDHTETEGEEGKSGDEGEVKAEMESNGQNMSGFHFLTEEEAETTDITDVSQCRHIQERSNKLNCDHNACKQYCFLLC